MRATRCLFAHFLRCTISLCQRGAAAGAAAAAAAEARRASRARERARARRSCIDLLDQQCWSVCLNASCPSAVLYGRSSIAPVDLPSTPLRLYLGSFWWFLASRFKTSSRSREPAPSSRPRPIFTDDAGAVLLPPPFPAATLRKHSALQCRLSRAGCPAGTLSATRAWTSRLSVGLSAPAAPPATAR
jgi:hypothetical protein